MAAKKTTRKRTPKKSSVVKKPTVVAADAKLRKKPEYKSFRLHRPVKRPDLALPSWFSVTKKAFRLLRANLRPIVWFFVVYGLLYVAFVRGVVSSVNIESVKNEISAVTGDSASSVTANIAVMGLLFESVLSSNGDVAGLYQVIFLIVSLLALIWLFRQQQAGNKVGIKDAFYRGMFPLVPFVLVFAVIMIQTLPAAIGNFIFNTVSSGGLAVTAFEQLIWILFFVTTLLLSLYMISSSLIALFIVTLPEMTPMLALNKAKELVSFRRANVLGKVIILMVLIGVIYVGVVLPSIFVSAIVAQIALFLVTVFTVPFAAAYLFVLYRELL